MRELTPDTYAKIALREFARTPAERRLAKPLIDHWGQRYLRKITRLKVYYYRSSRVRAGAAVSTVNKEVRLFARMMESVGLPLHLHGRMPETRPVKVSREQVEHILSTAAARPDWLDAYALAALSERCGLKRRVLRKLSWADCDPFAERFVVDGKSYTFGPHVRRALIALEQFRLHMPGRRRSHELVLRAYGRDAWAAIRKAAGAGPLSMRDLCRRRGGR